MKPFLFTILLLLVKFSVAAQPLKDTVVSMKYIDSLKREVAKLKERNNDMFWRFQEKVSISKIDTLFIRADSSIITYTLEDGKPLKRKFNILDKDNNINRYSIHYYDNKQHVTYIENWETLKDDDFDAKLSSAERIEYDSSGRQILSVTFYQSVHRTIRRRFWYDQSGAKQSTAEVIKSNALWDE